MRQLKPREYEGTENENSIEKAEIISELGKKRQQKCWGPDPKKNLVIARTTCARNAYKLFG